MARPGQLDAFSEHVSVMKALFAEYKKQDDHEGVAAVEATLADMRKFCAAQDASAMAIIKEAEEQRRALAQRSAAASARIVDLAAQLTNEESLLRQQLGLYAHISNIVWRTDITREVAGTISDPASAEIRSFALDPDSMTHFELVNKLWQLVK